MLAELVHRNLKNSQREGLAEFSNIVGLTHIAYPTGRVENAPPGIVKTLAREGVLDSHVRDRFLKRRKK